MPEIDFSKDLKFNQGKRITHGYIFGINYDLERYGSHFIYLFYLYNHIANGRYSFEVLKEYIAILETIFIEFVNFFGASEARTFKKQIAKCSRSLNQQKMIYNEIQELDMEEVEKVVSILKGLHEKIMIKKQMAGLGLSVDKEIALKNKLKNALG